MARILNKRPLIAGDFRSLVPRLFGICLVRLYPYRPRFSDWRFWGIQALTLAIATVHFAIEALRLMARLPGNPEALSFLPVSMFFVPIVYAALNFGLSGALATALWCTVLAVPSLLIFHPGAELPAELVQLGIVDAVTVFVGLRVDRETKARELAQATSKALQSSEEKYRGLFESSPVAVFLLDATGLVVDANPTSTALFGLPQRDLSGRSIASLIGEGPAKQLLEVPRSGSHRTDPITLQRSNAADLYLEPSVTPICRHEGGRALQVILTDITEERQRQAGLRAYAAHVLSAQEDERKRIAQELHDETVQGLVLLCRQLDVASEAAGGSGSPVAAGLQAARKSAEDAISQLRGFSRALRPPILEDLGLVTALRRSLVELSNRAGIDGSINIVGKEHRFPPDVELGIFRIAQEAFRNVERHAQASRVTARITFTKQDMALDIRDNGVGFELSSNGKPMANRHLGLLGMRERAEAMGGALTVQSAPAHGARIILTVPIHEDAPPRETATSTARSRG